jgi:HEAT repeat protein
MVTGMTENAPMKHLSIALIVVGIAAGFAGCGSTSSLPQTAAVPQFTVTELTGRLPAHDTLEARWISGALVAAGPDAIQDLCMKAGAPDQAAALRATYAVSGLTMYVNGKGREADRLLFVGAVTRALQKPSSPEHAVFLMEQLRYAGRQESLTPLVRFLNDDRLCEPAALAMQTIGGAAGSRFLEALPNAGWKPRFTIIRALGETKTVAAVPLLLEETKNSDPWRVNAGLQALAAIGDARAEATLRAVLTQPAGARTAGLHRLIAFADRRVALGDGTAGAQIAADVLAATTSPDEQAPHVAALDILARVNGEKALDQLFTAFAETSAAVQGGVLGIMNRIPGAAVTARCVNQLVQAPPPARMRLLEMLGDRKDASALPAVVGAMNDADAGVRGAAINAVVKLDPAKSVPALLERLTKSDEPADVQAVRDGLTRIPAAHVAAPAAATLAKAGPRGAVALLDLLGAMKVPVPSAPVLAMTKDDRAPVRGAAIKALGAVLQPPEAAALVDLVVKGKSDGERALAIKSLASVEERNPDREARSAMLIERLATAIPAEKPDLLKALARCGGREALRVVSANGKSKDTDTREAALRAMTEWTSMEAFDSLIVLARSKEKLPLRVLALRSCVRLVEAYPCSAVTAVRYHERTLAAAERPEEKRLVLGALANINSPDALRLLAPYIPDDSLGLEAAMASWKIAKRQDDPVSAEAVRRIIEPQLKPHFRASAARVFDQREGLNDAPEGFRALFNGRDLSGWKGLVENPIVRAKMTPEQLATAQTKADSSMRAHWSVADATLVFDGKGESLCTLKDYGDFEMLVDWKIEKNGDSGIYLRGSPQVQIWDPAQWPEGSGGLYNNQRGPSHPLVIADKPIGEWNTFRIRMIGDRVTVYLNNVLVVDSVALENYWDRSIPIFPTGQLELQSHNSPLFFRNVFIREIPRKKTVSGETIQLLNGKDLTGWEVIEGKPGSWGVQDGVLFTTGEGGGWLSTVKEYDNFLLDLDFKVVQGGNSGVFLRSPRKGDPAYVGMEVQVLDDYAAQYATLKPWQYTGSVYGVQPPSSRATKHAGEWQHMQITAQGTHVKVVLNGTTTVDTDLLQHMEKAKEHPGLQRRAGFIGLQNHSTRVEYRNITIRELE